MALGDPLQRRDCVVTAHHWFRVLARTPGTGSGQAGDHGGVREDPADFTSMKDVCGTIALSPMDHETSDVHLRRRDPLGEAHQSPVRPGRQDLPRRHRPVARRLRGVELERTIRRPRQRRVPGSSTWPRARGSGRGASPPPSTGTSEGRASRTRPGDSAWRIHVPTGVLRLRGRGQRRGPGSRSPTPFQLTSVLWRNDAPRGPGSRAVARGSHQPEPPRVGARGGDPCPGRPPPGPGNQGQRRLRVVRAPQGFFGLGDWPSVQSIRVTWPDWERLRSLRADADLRALHADPVREIGLSGTGRRTRASERGRGGASGPSS
jgi:hypothetical protein